MKRAIVAVGLAALLAGCGGGGSGTGGSASPAKVALFFTDSFSSNDHVWVTVKSVDLITSGGTTNVFSNPTGTVVDLKTLRDSTGARFQFMNQGSVPAGTYSGAKVTLDNNLVIFPHLATVGTPMTFDPQYADGSGNSAISFNFDHPHTVKAGTDDVIVDFDLANWNAVGNVVTVSLKEGSNQGIDSESRHEEIHYPGTVANLAGTAPTFTFALTHHGNANGFPVSTDANTNIFEDDGLTPTLADGTDVIVEGEWDPVSGTLLAKSVRVMTAADEQTVEARAEGPLTEFSEANGFLRISTHESEGFVPLANSVRIEWTSNTVFVAGDNVVTVDQFFALLAAGAEVSAEGDYNPGTFVLTAKHVHLDVDGGGDGGTTGGTTGGTSTGTTGGTTGDSTTGTTGGTTGDTTGTTGGTTGTTGTTGDTTTGTTGTTGDTTTGTTGTTGDTTTGTTGTTGDTTTGTSTTTA